MQITTPCFHCTTLWWILRDRKYVADFYVSVEMKRLRETGEIANMLQMSASNVERLQGSRSNMWFWNLGCRNRDSGILSTNISSNALESRTARHIARHCTTLRCTELRCAASRCVASHRIASHRLVCFETLAQCGPIELPWSCIIGLYIML